MAIQVAPELFPYSLWTSIPPLDSLEVEKAFVVSLLFYGSCSDVSRLAGHLVSDIHKYSRYQNVDRDPFIVTIPMIEGGRERERKRGQLILALRRGPGPHGISPTPPLLAPSFRLIRLHSITLPAYNAKERKKREKGVDKVSLVGRKSAISEPFSPPPFLHSRNGTLKDGILKEKKKGRFSLNQVLPLIWDREMLGRVEVENNNELE